MGGICVSVAAFLHFPGSFLSFVPLVARNESVRTGGFRGPFPLEVCVRRIAKCLEAGLDDAVGLQGGDGDVGDPQDDEDSGGDGLDGLGPAELAADGGGAATEEDEDGDQGLGTEHGDGETQAAEGRGSVE